MRIKAKLTFNFSILVAGILVLSSLSVYLFSLAHRHQNFTTRLKYKAISTASILFNVKDVDVKMLQLIDSNTVTAMKDLNVIVLDKQKKVLYSNSDSVTVVNLLPHFNYLRWENNSYRFYNNRLYLCTIYNNNGEDHYVLATAEDMLGQTELQNLRIILFIVFFISLSLTIIAGWVNTRQSLKPIKEIIRQADEIKPSNLNSRIEGETSDEIGDLVKTFNKMLDRIERAFDTERMFISNASHELRTPITSIKGQLEVGLSKPRDTEEYRALLNSVLDDVKNMATIINGFLELAETNIEPGSIMFNKLRLDELVFSVKDEIIRRKKGYMVNIDFESIPEEESNITIYGNERLLRMLIINLIDNACKFSENKKCNVFISYDSESVTLKVVDSGIGIPKEDLKNIFNPLYRSNNVNKIPGFGIGLSIVQRIATIHGAKLHVNSEINVGTIVSATFTNTN